MIPNAAINYPSNHMHIMTSGDDLSRFWSNGYGLAAKNYIVIFANDFIRKYGIYALYNKIKKDIIENDISLLLIDISSQIYDPFIFFDLKQKYGLMVVLLALDDEFKFDLISSSYATIADLVITTDYVSVNRYRQAGVNARFFALPTHIEHEVIEQRNDVAHSVTFIGRVDEGKPSRAEFVRFLTRNGINVSYFGGSGPSDPLFLSRDEMYSIFRNSAINLSFTGITTYLDRYNNILNERVRGMKLRPFEIIAAGGFCISEFSISLAKLLEDGVDIVYFKSKIELLEKINYFLNHQDEAKAIATNGATKVAKRFSCEALAKRLKELIQESQGYLGIDLYGEPHRVKVSQRFASTFIVFTFSNSATLLFRGRLLSFFNDSWVLLKFLRRFSVDNGTLLTLKVIFVVLYMLGQVVLANVRSMILRLVGTFFRQGKDTYG